MVQTDENMRAFLLAGASMYVQKAANMLSKVIWNSVFFPPFIKKKLVPY
jgi:hypothetical protein